MGRVFNSLDDTHRVDRLLYVVDAKNLRPVPDRDRNGRERTRKTLVGRSVTEHLSDKRFTRSSDKHGDFRKLSHQPVKLAYQLQILLDRFAEAYPDVEHDVFTRNTAAFRESRAASEIFGNIREDVVDRFELVHALEFAARMHKNQAG